MKYILTKEEHEKLPEAVQGEYVEQDGAFVLNLEGHDEHLIPKAKRDIEAEHRKAAEKKLSEIEDREAKLLKDLEASKGNKTEVEEIRKQHEAEMEKVRQEYAAKEEAAKAESHKALVDAEAEKFAQKNFTVPSAIKRLYQDRLAVEEIDGQPVIRAREPDGKPSVKSVQELQKEFLENSEFKSIIKVEVGKGGGANPDLANKGGGAPKQVSRSEFEAMDQPSRMSFSKDGGEVVDG